MPKISIILATMVFFCFYSVATKAQSCPQNIDFEDGNLNYWKFYTDSCCPINTPVYTGPVNNRHTLTSGNGTDPYGGFPIVSPGGGSYSLKLGNNQTGAQAEMARYYIHVPNNINNYSLIFRYAVVFQDPNHQASDQPRFEVKAYDSATNSIINCSNFSYVATSNLPGFKKWLPNNPLSRTYYRPWTTGSLNLSGQAGKTIIVEFATGDCAQGAHYGYGYVDLDCGLFQISYDACDTSSTIDLEGPPGFEKYEWKDTSNWTTVDTGKNITISRPNKTTNYALILTPYSGYGCQDTLYTTVYINNLNINATNDTTVCNADSIQLDAGATGDAKPLKYKWMPTTNLSCDTCATPTVYPVTSTTYYVTVEDANGCTKQDTVSITKQQLSLNSTVQSASCFGEANGTITTTATGGTTPYTYSWNTTPVKTTSTITNLNAGTYILTTTDSIGCSRMDSFTIGQPDTLIATIDTATNTSCQSSNSGSATVTVTGGTQPYSYSWNTTPVQTTATATNLSAGTYTVTVTDSNGCTDTAQVLISGPDTIAATVTANDATCNGSNNGSATAVISAGTSPYTYSWNTTPIQTTATATNLSTGTYTVTIIDSNGCTDTATVDVVSSDSVVSSISTTTNVTCNSGNNGTATVTTISGANPYTYSWNTNPTQTTQTATNLSAGTYTVIVTDSNGCSDTTTANITEPQPVVANITTTTKVACNGGNNGTATVNATGGVGNYTYSWNTTPIQTTQTATNLTAGTYTVTVTDSNGCTDTALATISQNQTIIASIASVTNTSCNGDNDGTTSVTVSGGTTPYTYSWNTTPVQTTSSISSLTAGTYTVTVTDSNGCTDTALATITEPQPVVANISATTNVACNNGNDGAATVTVTGGTTPYTYSWNTTPVQTTPSVANLTAGTYTATVTDKNGCTDTATASITEPQPLAANVSTTTNVTCNGGNNGAATVNVTGGTTPYTYNWNTNPTQTTQTATNLSAGTYTITITDSNNCITTTTATITEPQPVVANITATTKVACNGGNNGTATVNATGGVGTYTYSWNTTPIQTTQTATNLTAGTYTVTVTDSNGCTDTALATISQNQTIIASIASVTNNSCNGDNDGATSVTVSGGTSPYTYSWNTTPVQTTSSISSLTAGTYTVTVTDSNGCTDTAVATITEPQPVVANISATTNVACSNGNDGAATVTVTGGTTPYTYSWNTTPVQTTPSVANLTAGTYTATVTDKNGCTDTATASIAEPQPLAANISSTTNIICYGGNNGAATVNVTGGTTPYTYNWNTNPTQTTQTATNLSAGTYTITITDSNNCTVTVPATITEPQPVVPNITATTDVPCNGGNNGTATVNATGGVGTYTYSWNTTPIQTTQTATNLTAGTYTVTVTDGNNCSASTQATIQQPNTLTTSVVKTDVSCSGEKNGTATVLPNGGTSPYTYSWNTTPVQTNAAASSLAAGTYIVTVTDKNGCVDTQSTIISQPQPITTTITANHIKCHGGTDGTTSVTAAGGTAPYTYSWNTTPTQTSTSASNLSSGVYTVTITDQNGCQTSATDTVTEPTKITISAKENSKACIDLPNGAAEVTVVSGGTPPYTYFWSTTPVQNTRIINGIYASVYNITVTDSNGCKQSENVEVENYPKVDLNLTPNQEICPGDSVQLNVSGGSNYQWLKATGLSCANCDNPIAKPTNTTQYTVALIDTNNCKDTGTVAITVLTRKDVSVGQDREICEGDAVSLEANGGVAYNWSPSAKVDDATSSTPTFIGKSSEAFTVYITQNKCFTDTLTQNITVHPTPEVDLGGDLEGYIGETFQLNATTQNADRIEWVSTDGLDCYNCFNPRATVESSTTYKAIVYNDAAGCVNEDEIKIVVKCDASMLTAPNTFTPNGDGLNDRFYPLAQGAITVKHMSVYNRWGERIYSVDNFPANTPNFGWDGTYKNNELTPDVFVYMIESTCKNGEPILIKGDISLIR